MSNKKRKAFTLTELLIVVVIIGVLSAVVLPKFSKVLETRKTTEAEAMMVAVRNEQEARCSISKNYTADLSKLASLNKQSDTKNYKYEDLEGVGVQASAKGSYTYNLRMPSYVDGRICCEGQDCEKLNKDYPTCDELQAKGDYVPGNTECEAEPPCNGDHQEGEEASNTACECGGPRIEQWTCQGTEWVKKVVNDCRPAEECQPTTDRRLCGGGTEQNPDEAEIEWKDGTKWEGATCYGRGQRLWSPPDKYNVAIPDDATEEQIQELCCGGEGDCPEGTWLTARDTCCPIGQVVIDNKGTCGYCDPKKNQVVSSSGRKCIDRFQPKLGKFGMLEDEKVYGPHFEIRGPQCAERFMGKTLASPCPRNTSAGDYCNSCDASQPTCNKACYFDTEPALYYSKIPALGYAQDRTAWEARKRWQEKIEEQDEYGNPTGRMAAGFNKNIQNVGNCSASLSSENVRYSKHGGWYGSRYRIVGWLAAWGNVNTHFEKGVPSTIVCEGSYSSRPSCKVGIDPERGSFEWWEKHLEEEEQANGANEQNNTISVQTPHGVVDLAEGLYFETDEGVIGQVRPDGSVVMMYWNQQTGQMEWVTDSKPQSDTGNAGGQQETTIVYNEDGSMSMISNGKVIANMTSMIGSIGNGGYFEYEFVHKRNTNGTQQGSQNNNQSNNNSSSNIDEYWTYHYLEWDKTYAAPTADYGNGANITLSSLVGTAYCSDCKGDSVKKSLSGHWEWTDAPAYTTCDHGGSFTVDVCTMPLYEEVWGLYCE